MSTRGMAARKGVLDGQDVAPRGTTKSASKKLKAVKGGKSTKAARPSAPAHPHLRRGVMAVMVLAFALATALAVLSFHSGKPGANLIGRVGHTLAATLFDAVGICAFLVPFPLFSLGASLATPDPARRHWARGLALTILALSGACLAHLVIGTHPGQEYPPGGWIGIHLGSVLQLNLGFWGAAIAISAIGASAVVVATDGWLVRAGVAVGRFSKVMGEKFGVIAWQKTREAAIAFQAAQEERKKQRAEEAEYMAQVLAEEERADAEAEAEEAAREAQDAADEADALAGVSDKNRGLVEAHAEGDRDEVDLDGEPGKRKKRGAPDADPAWATTLPPTPADDAKVKGKKGEKLGPAIAAEPEKSPLPKIVLGHKKGDGKEVPFDEGDVEVLAQANPDDVLKTSLPPQPAKKSKKGEKAAEAKAEEAKSADAAVAPIVVPPAEASAQPAQPVIGGLPAIIERPKIEKVKKKQGEFVMADGVTSFKLPPVDALEIPEEKKALRVDQDVFFATAEKLRLKLKDFGIEGEVKEIHPGPVVTMYEFVPGPGIKISKIASLADDLAMAMEALRVRIVAPIPGKGSVGIEVPNKERETVYLREIVESEKYVNSGSKLTMCLGKNIEGMPFVMDLAKAPHLLMAGTTGSGKSVSVNSMITSILLKATPEEVRFIMVDPKMLELSIYEGIPHLLLPVVTDSKKAALALRWAVEEMERRYQLMSDVGVRNLAGYNKLVESGTLPVKEAPKPDAKIVVDMSDGSTSLEQPEVAEADKPEPPRKLPYIVVIIDELADLMMVASREVETYIARLAQMARAAGIHLMVATQRPSTDVVTGVIKANFPSRISFMLRSKPDSMTILGQTGAEALLGMGDMLVQPPTDAHVIRVHGAYVSEVEIKKIVDHLKAQGKPIYDESILKPREEDGAGGEGGGEDDELSDELYDQALAIVSEMRDVSISILQRKLRIGYNRSARMIERMERDGVVGAADGSKPRKVLIRPVGQMPGAGAME